jgi:uncharacterized membrane protein YqjE
VALADSLSRLGATAVLVVRQRLELAALDVEEELLRVARLLAGALSAVLLAVLALAWAAALVVTYFWDTARMEALAGVTLAFAAAAAFVAWKVAAAWDAKPPLLATTLAELRKDREALARGGE